MNSITLALGSDNFKLGSYSRSGSGKMTPVATVAMEDVVAQNPKSQPGIDCN